MKSFEVNFDGLVGPTHNYAGLSEGNVASLKSALDISNPKSAAKQGLAKMKALHDLGLTQGVLAPQERPDIHTLRRLGFTGTDAQVLSQAHKEAPNVLAACYSASSMWTANAATISPSADTHNNKVHFTPANLTNKFHRSLEPETTGNILKAMFNNDEFFEHHLHLNDNDHFGDEGAANHTRLCGSYGDKGLEIFTFGRSAFNRDMPKPQIFAARQTLEASKSVARLHGLSNDNTVFVQQNPDVIDQGVFHNDVIAVGNQNVLFYHEQAFLNTAKFIDEVKQKLPQQAVHFIEVPSNQVSISDAVNTYLFNTQIITLADGSMAIIAPKHCENNINVKTYLDNLIIGNTPIKQVKYFDVNESMKNGGGPACLRLRVALNAQELDAVNPACIMSNSLFTRLNTWVDSHYRDTISPKDLQDPQLLIESRAALDELTKILNLGSVYKFQQV
ncbi:N-succinylarginine dihydrolase [Pseudoalteromonas denitrificans]|uniref:N-succinylarginine dihydrolase n=1 Tax=Pseudoalteromonas denitrificans DSM 6059 TaxID=1123010 RepID=A0A1I1N0D4_9GAMM|nr:N-succinylarginine dihydrolase [Pseudoalteromonas denitrificans]SFC90612.1 succinylarginine dihydrolase [Pseudoalteromonas denitrificans DSM 6059]